MDIPQKDLDEFKAIYKQEYGVELSDEEAGRIASKVIGFFEIICRPLPEFNPHKDNHG